ncbi:PhzF family phenazine biosynthesis protein [Undibacterium sp. SXout11W]|uniref:PhzF family phenazine biosynthesis protein n=1 Tax=Undibacterium sp. SXout11W TaxID=3413050 RepID=UPI003BF04644
MRSYPFRIFNVFAESTFGGNPLCVFEHADGLSDAEMQALALQFNLSETCFILPSDKATARMRIFTPDTEMAFAGHPSIGTAQLVQELYKGPAHLTLECKAGIVPLQLHENVWTFAAPQAPKVSACETDSVEIARILGLDVKDFSDEPLWVNTGSDQLLVPLVNEGALLRAKLNSALLDGWPKNSLGRKTVYLFTFDQIRRSHTTRVQVKARYFFARPGGGVGEDPATGSACANLGGWWIAHKRNVPASLHISQGGQMQRPSHIYLDILEDMTIKVGGKVQEIGRGVIQI